MPSFPEPVQTLYVNALQHEQAADWGAAGACYEQAVKLVTDSPELWARYGQLLGRKGVRNSDGHIGLAAFSRAAKCPATTAEELYWRGVGALLNDGDGDSRRDLAASLALDPTRADAWYRFAEALETPSAYVSPDDYDASPEGQARRLAAYDQALALNPTNDWYRVRRGRFHLLHDRLDEALADLDAALLHQTYYHAAELRAVTRFLRHDFRGALQDFRTSSWRGLEGDWREARVEYVIKYPDKRQPSPVQRWNDALALFELTGLREPTSAKYLSERAHYFLKHDAPVRALADAEATVALRPGHAPYRELRVACQQAQATPDFAALLTDCEWLLEALRPRATRSKRTDNPGSLRSQAIDQALSRRARYGYYAAWAHFRLGRPEQALAHFAAATDRPPEEPRRDRGRMSGEWSPYSLGIGDVKYLPPPVFDTEYLRWQLEHQLAQEVTDPERQRTINEWLLAAAQVLNVPELAQAMEQYRDLWVPAGHYYGYARADAVAKALTQYLVGMQQPLYKTVFAQLYRGILRSELRDAQNRPDASAEQCRAALDHYEARIADYSAK
ncbi:hypothetical protein GCM10022407_14450 [Hymenobacter antarcticus]|uniref:Tetratricopeptide repeat-containing protein n=2 Tax=Hymenobacter antarcticus TaxID=486270 RepID=A0ABP7PRD3_9BACT